jgi:hypothetical protein
MNSPDGIDAAGNEGVSEDDMTTQIEVVRALVEANSDYEIDNNGR